MTPSVGLAVVFVGICLIWIMIVLPGLVTLVRMWWSDLTSAWRGE